MRLETKRRNLAQAEVLLVLEGDVLCVRVHVLLRHDGDSADIEIWRDI